MPFVIYTDSGCDLGVKLLDKWGVRYESLTFQFDGEETRYRDQDMPIKEFYEKMRAGGVSKTSAVNVGDFLTGFERELQAGNDILYIGFDSGISTTSNSGIMAAEELRAKYPERRIIAFDSLAASGGQGLLVWIAVQKRDAGESMEEIADYIQKVAPKIATWFTVSDLIYLKRGGRISATSYFAASVLDIKPLLHVDDAGKLISVRKVRSRRKSIRAMIELYETTSLQTDGMFVVSHGDAEEEANAIVKELEERFGARGIVTPIGPVIGSHAGPGTLVLSFPACRR